MDKTFYLYMHLQQITNNQVTKAKTQEIIKLGTIRKLSMLFVLYTTRSVRSRLTVMFCGVQMYVATTLLQLIKWTFIQMRVYFEVTCNVSESD